MNKKGHHGMNFAGSWRPAAFAATMCEKKRRKIHERADFALCKFKDEGHAARLEIVPSELPF